MAMSGISFLTLATGSGDGASGAVAGVFGVSLMGRVYTTLGVKRRAIQDDGDMIAEEMAAMFDEDRVSHQHGNSEPEAD